MITDFVRLMVEVQGMYMRVNLLVAGLGRNKVILGLSWLEDVNPDINWKKGTLKWRDPPDCVNGEDCSDDEEEAESSSRAQFVANILNSLFQEETKPEDIHDNNLVISYMTGNPAEETKETWGRSRMDTMTKLEELIISYVKSRPAEEIQEIRAALKMNKLTELATEVNAKKEEKTAEELVPKEFHDYMKVFSDEEAARFPERKPWDHEINLQDDFKPKSLHIYLMSPAEDKELQEFLKENLDKGYIRKSKLPQAVPFFFVAKKDGRLQPIQDYRYLNEWTTKDAYLLPLITDLMDRLCGKKYFTKMDIRWEYNNVRIKEGDEWKAAFKTKFGLFEPTIMFFGLTNSPATFQKLMDSIFAEEIAEGWLTVYMDHGQHFNRF